MISGGNAIIIVADMDRSIRFYTEILNLKLTNRFGNDWATVSAGEGLTIGINPASAKYPAPGTKGAIALGLDIDVPIEIAISRLTQRGVTTKGVSLVAIPAISPTWKIPMETRSISGKRFTG